MNASAEQVTPTAPAWYSEAIAARPLRSQVAVPGATIALRHWGPDEGPLVVLVHGGAAHGGWWDHIAPALAGAARVVAIDSSGQGDSSWRPEYTLPIWAEELRAVTALLSRGFPTTLVGHSRGGMVSLLAASDIPDLRQVVVVEAAFAVDPPPANNRPHRIYPTRAEAVRRFRTLPAEPQLDFVIPHIARESVREMPNGWTWKFDPRIQGKPSLGPGDVSRASCPVTLVRGSRGLASPDVVEAVRSNLGPQATVKTMQGAGHHIMLNRPVELMQELLGHVQD